MVFETKQNYSEIFSKNKFQANRKWGKNIHNIFKKSCLVLCIWHILNANNTHNENIFSLKTAALG